MHLHGYSIWSEMVYNPLLFAYSRPNQRTALLEREFVNGAVWELQKGGYIEVAKETPCSVQPPISSHKWGRKEATSGEPETC